MCENMARIVVVTQVIASEISVCICVPWGKIPPFRTENPAHNAAAKDDMLLPLKAVHIAFPNVASVMQKAGRPDPEIPRKPEQFPPPIGDEQWMKPNRMDSKKYTLGSDSHPE